MFDYVCNISPVDGRYKETTEEVRKYFSEYHLIRNRVIVEIEWLKKLFQIKELKVKYNNEDLKILEEIVEEFNLAQAERVKEIEKTTNHDVKAVEYYLDEKLEENHLEKYNHLIHFACTSEDINNLAYGIMIKQLIQNVYIPSISELINTIQEKAKKYANIPMLSHTHGQNATPTTVGKEFSVFTYRLRKNFKQNENRKNNRKIQWNSRKL